MAGPISKKIISGSATAPVFSAKPKAEGLMGVKNLLARRIREYHQDTEFTQKCVDKLQFSDRPLTDKEKLTALAICRCYDSRIRERMLVRYLDYLEKTRSTDIDLPGMLYQFRLDPTSVLNLNKYGMFKTGEIKREIEKDKK